RLGVDGLVALPIRRAVVAVDIGRKGHVSNALYAGEEIGDWGEADAPLAETASLGDLGFQSGVASGWFAKVEFFSDPDLSAGPHQAFPLDRIVRHLAG